MLSVETSVSATGNLPFVTHPMSKAKADALSRISLTILEQDTSNETAAAIVPANLDILVDHRNPRHSRCLRTFCLLKSSRMMAELDLVVPRNGKCRHC